MTAVDHDVIVIGAGPAGLLLAAELTRRGIDTALLERRTESRSEGEAGSRAVGVHPPVLAALESSGATERILDEGARIPRGIARARGRTIGEVRLDRLPIRFPFAVSVPQAITEAAVAAGGPIPRRGVCAVSLAERSDHVAVAVRRGSGRAELRARAVVVAAGASGRDLVEPFIPQRGRAYRDRYLMADLLSAPGQPRDTAMITLHPAGVVESFPLPGGGRRLVARIGASTEGGSSPSADEAAAQLRRAVADRTGEERLAAGIELASAFGIRRALLRRMRCGRVIAIGDTAHEVSPIGGQGMNLALLDAVALAPVLARWLTETGAEAGGTRELDRWERDRLASARTAARLAGMNTALGRSRAPWAFACTAAAIGASLSTPLARSAARAYAMGFDRAAKRPAEAPLGLTRGTVAEPEA